MVTVFICTDDTLAKVIAGEYMSREQLPYCNMLNEDITYDQVVKAIERLERGSEETITMETKVGMTPPPVISGIHPFKEKDEEDKGELVAICDEALAPTKNSMWVLQAFVLKTGKYRTTFTEMTHEQIRQCIDSGVLLIKTEKEFNKKYGSKNNKDVSNDSSLSVEDKAE